jgi:hypothetical protein
VLHWCLSSFGEKAAPIRAVGRKQPGDGADRVGLRLEQLRVVGIEKQPHCAAMPRRKFHQKIENLADIVFGTVLLRPIIKKQIGQHLPKYAPPQPGLADPIRMDAVMHLDLRIIEYRVAEISDALGDEQLLVRQ